MALLRDRDLRRPVFQPLFWGQGRPGFPLKSPHNAASEYPLPMRQLRTEHISLFRLLRDQFLFLTRTQIERVLTLATRATNKELVWLVAERYLRRRYRADTFAHFQIPLYYLGERGWHAVGNPKDKYRAYKGEIERRSERHINHTLSIYDVLLKFILESDVKRIVTSDDRIWRELIDFGNIPDAWIQLYDQAVFIEVDRHTEWGNVLRKKFDNYIRFKDSGGYRNRFPDCTFRVLVFTTTEARIEFMERLVTSDDVWFCTMKEFLREKLNHEHWFTVHGFYALPVATKKEV